MCPKYPIRGSCVRQPMGWPALCAFSTFHTPKAFQMLNYSSSVMAEQGKSYVISFLELKTTQNKPELKFHTKKQMILSFIPSSC